jgi:hypothetical protein
MRLTEAFTSATIDEIKAALDGGKLVLYSTGRPPSADHAITRSTPLANFTFAAPAFAAGDADGVLTPLFAEASVKATSTGTPGFARAFKADGAVVVDFSIGAGAGEVKLTEVSATAAYPVKVVSIKIALPPEKVEWAKTEAGHVYVTNADNPYRKLSVHG